MDGGEWEEKMHHTQDAGMSVHDYNVYSLSAACYDFLYHAIHRCSRNVSYLGFFSEWLFIGITVVGILNNLGSIIVFYATLFKARAFAFVFKFYFLINLVVGVTALTPYIFYNITRLKVPQVLRGMHFLNVTSLQTSHGIMSLLCVMRVIYPRCKPVGTSQHSVHACLFFILSIIVASVGSNIIYFIEYEVALEKDVNHFVFYMVTTSINTICILLWAVGLAEKPKKNNPNDPNDNPNINPNINPNNNSTPTTAHATTTNNHPNSPPPPQMSASSSPSPSRPRRGRVTNLLTKYIMYSAMFCTITTLPALIIALIPFKELTDLECDKCAHLTRATTFFNYCLYANAYGDNLVYYTFIPSYRFDIIDGIINILSKFTDNRGQSLGDSVRGSSTKGVSPKRATE